MLHALRYRYLAWATQVAPGARQPARLCLNGTRMVPRFKREARCPGRSGVGSGEHAAPNSNSTSRAASAERSAAASFSLRTEAPEESSRQATRTVESAGRILIRMACCSYCCYCCFTLAAAATRVIKTGSRTSLSPLLSFADQRRRSNDPFPPLTTHFASRLGAGRTEPLNHKPPASSSHHCASFRLGRREAAPTAPTAPCRRC